MTVVGALGVIFQSNVFRAALSLILCLAAVAGIFVTLSADFLAGAQILIYVGATLRRNQRSSRNRPEAIIPSRFLCVADMIRMFTGMEIVPPTHSISFF